VLRRSGMHIQLAKLLGQASLPGWQTYHREHSCDKIDRQSNSWTLYKMNIRREAVQLRDTLV